MTTDEALLALAASTAEAVAGALRTLLPGGVEVAAADVVPDGTPPMAGVPVPGVAAEVTHTDGASGGTVLATTVAGGRALAAAIAQREPRPGPDALDEHERSALAEAMAQVMAAAAAATSGVLGQEVGVSPPRVRDVATAEDALALAAGAPHATRVELTVAGHPCRLVQLVPKAFVLRMTRALDERAALDAASPAGDGARAAAAGPTRELLLQRVSLRVSAEIGRATMPLARAVGLPAGEVVELDRGADEPVDLFVNGRRFARGRLVLVDDEWAVRVDDVFLDAKDLPQATRTPIERH